MKRIGEYLDEALREIFEERAGIVEFDGKKTREEAEKQAREDVQKEIVKGEGKP